MLLTKTYLSKSKISGIGLFAAEFIPKGKIIWEFLPGFDFTVKKGDLDKLPALTREFVLHYGYLKNNEHTVCVDNSRFFNHSDDPNTDNTNKKWTIAKKNIETGEEITCNYFEFDVDAKSKLLSNKIPLRK